MALAENSNRMRISTYILKDSKNMLEEISKKCNLSQSKVIDLAIEELYKKIKTEGLTIKME